MAPSTPSHSPKRHEFDTTKRARFFDAWDAKEKTAGVSQICRKLNFTLPPSTARYWLRQRDIQGSPAIRRTRKQAPRLGRKSKVSALDLERLTNQQNLIHQEPYKIQAETLPDKPSAYTLQAHATQAGARRFKKRYTTEISKKNKPIRVEYGKKHEIKTLTGFWQQVGFTDEAHFQSVKLQNKAEYGLRFPGQETTLKETKTTSLNVTLHIAGLITYNRKGRLHFYKDPQEPSLKAYKPRKPRQTMYQTDKQYKDVLMAWEAAQPDAEVIPKGNAMSQQFYAKEILPQYIKEIKALEQYYHKRFYLQEDGDPSHGNRSKDNPCSRLKRDADLQILVHPAQSPDLNPIEACWQIIKQRLRGGSWNTVAEFKAAIQREWDRITIAQIRRRIREMPWRCKRIQEINGERVRSDLW
jgi:DDE superfamily endonuclease